MKKHNPKYTEADRKARPKYLLITVLACLLGGVMGVACSLLLPGADLTAAAQAAERALPVAAVALHLAATLVTLAVALPAYRKAKALSARDDGEDEALNEQVEALLSRMVAAVSIYQVVAYLLFGLSTLALRQESLSGLAILALSLVELCVAIGIIPSFMRNAVNLLRERNPEKRGSVYQMNFNKTWVDSCDEAERAQIHQAGYAAYMVGVYTCLALWLVATLGCLFGLLGWIPVLFVSLIWLALQIGYLYTAGKLARHRSGTVSPVV